MVQTAEAQTGIKMMLSFFPAIGTLLGAFFMFIYPLSEKKMLTISAELAVRRETDKSEESYLNDSMKDILDRYFKLKICRNKNWKFLKQKLKRVGNQYSAILDDQND